MGFRRDLYLENGGSGKRLVFFGRGNTQAAPDVTSPLERARCYYANSIRPGNTFIQGRI